MGGKRIRVKNYMRCYDFYGSDGYGGRMLPIFRPYRRNTFAASSDQSFVNLHSDQNHISISTDSNQESITKTPAGNNETTASIQPPSFKYLPYKK